MERKRKRKKRVKEKEGREIGGVVRVGSDDHGSRVFQVIFE